MHSTSVMLRGQVLFGDTVYWGVGSHMHVVFLFCPTTDDRGMSPEVWSGHLMGIVARHYRYLDDLLQLEATSALSPSCSWPRGPTPLSVEAFAHHLRSHPDQQFAAFILRRVSFRFWVGYSPGRRALWSQRCNHPSSLANQAVVASHITNELLAGRLVGPIPESLQSVVHTSPIGLVPKGHASGRWRMIVNLSSPQSASVNSGIDKTLCSLQYTSLDDAIGLIRHFGPRLQLMKMDLRDAYRVIPVHPDDHHLLGIVWDGATYIDQSLPFGLRSAPKLFMAVADAMAWALHSSGIQYLLHYLDDFLFVGPPGSQDAAIAGQVATAVFHELGMPVAVHKTEGPATKVTFLGFQVDTLACQLRIPDDKLARLQDLVHEWCNKQSCTRKEFVLLLGHLSHASIAVRHEWLYLCQLFALLSSAHQPFYYVRFNRLAWADIVWWLFFLKEGPSQSLCIRMLRGRLVVVLWFLMVPGSVAPTLVVCGHHS